MIHTQGKGCLVSERAFVLYNTNLAPYSSLAPYSLCMRGENFDSNTRYYGLPSQPASIPSDTLSRSVQETTSGALKAQLERYIIGNHVDTRHHRYMQPYGWIYMYDKSCANRLLHRV